MKPMPNFFFQFLACKSLLRVCIFFVHLLWKKDCSSRVPFPQSTYEYKKPYLFKPHYFFALNFNASHCFCVYICCSLQISFQCKQIVLTFVALDFSRFVGGPTSITNLELITCYISLCTVHLDPKSKFMYIITIE